MEEAPGMDETTTRDLEARLRAELTSLEAEGELGAEDRATVMLDQQSVGRLSRMDAMQRQAMAAARARRLDARRGRILAALARIEEGEFGYCAECGDDISTGRLEQDPTVSTCIDCARG